MHPPARLVMASKTWLLASIFLLSITTHFAFVTSQFQAVACVNNGTSTSGSLSSFRADLTTLLPSLSSNMGDTGFHNASSGAANAIALCKADIPLSQCRSCVDALAGLIPQRCPNQFQAIMWRQDCMVRSSNEPLLGKLATMPGTLSRNVDSVASPDEFDTVRGTLFNDLRAEAAGGGALRKAAAGSRSSAAANWTIYAMAQCTPDLSPVDCTACLDNAAVSISQCCSGSLGVMAYRPSCTLRYDTRLFYNITRLQELQQLSMPPPSSPSSTPPATAGTTTEVSGGRTNYVIIVVPIAVFIIVALCVGIFVRKRMKRKAKADPESMKLTGINGEHESTTQTTTEEPESTKQKMKPEPENMKQEVKEEPPESMEQTARSEHESGGEISNFESIRYDFGKIRAATNDFSDVNKLGQGGFGPVYKGKLQNGPEIAVKRLLYSNSGQGEVEFKNEAVYVANLQHRNLVRLLGFSIEGTERLLVYEFVQNGSLDHFISDPIKCSSLDWGARYKIIEGVARGLLYLHKDSRFRLIHRDLKASNVLLDEEMNPKISDFGLAKLVVGDDTHQLTARVIGTFGYMAPEYVNHLKISVKSDVFSFGVLVLEIVTGQRIGFQNGENPGDFLSRAWRSWSEAGKGANMIDGVLIVNSGPQREILRCFHIALLCVQKESGDRPTMDSVLQMLGGFPPELPSPKEPGFYIPSDFCQPQELII